MEVNSLAKMQAQLQRAVDMLNKQQFSTNTERNKLVQENEQIKELKQKIERAYLNKYHAAQIYEKQARKMKELTENINIQNNFSKQNILVQNQNENNENKKLTQKKQYAQELRQQMLQKQKRIEESKKNYYKEKRQVDKDHQKLIEQEKKRIKEEEEKKRLQFQIFKESLQEKEQRQKQLKQQQIEENKKYSEYKAKVYERDQFKDTKKIIREQNQKKIFDQLKQKQEEEQRKIEELEDLKEKLRNEEMKHKQREQEIQDRIKKQNQKEEMQKWEQIDREFKKQKQLEEENLKKKFIEQMMNDFERKEKLEQLSKQKRRMMIHRHKKEVDKLWQIRQQQFELEKQRELQRLQIQKEKNNLQEDWIQEEKLKLLQEHLPYIEDFCDLDLKKELNKLKNQLIQILRFIMDFDNIIKDYLLSKNKKQLDEQQIINILSPQIDKSIQKIIIQKYINRLNRDRFIKEVKNKDKLFYQFQESFFGNLKTVNQILSKLIR